MKTTRSRATTAALLLAGYGALAVLLRLPVWASPTTVIGGSADAVQTAWFLAWTPHALGAHTNPFITHAINAPAGVNLLWNTSIPAGAVLLWPVTAATNAVLTFNLIDTASLALSAWCAYLALRRFTRTWWAAALGGLLYGFSPLMSAQEGAHAQIVAAAPAVPLMLMLMHDALVRQRGRWWITGILMGALLVLEFFIFEEFFVTTILAAAGLVVVLALVRRHEIRAHAAHAARVLALAGAVVVVALAYPVWVVQLHGPDSVTGPIHVSGAFSTWIANFVLPTPVEWLSPAPLRAVTGPFSVNSSEADAYLGIPLLLLVALCLVRRWREPVVKVAALLGLVVAVGSLGPRLRPTTIPLPWIVPEHLPLLNDILPSRLMIFTFLAVALLFALALESLAPRQRAVRVLAPALAAALVFVTVAPRLPFHSQPASPAPFFRGSAVQAIPANALVYALPWPSSSDMDAMDGQLAAGFRFSLVGGYFIGPPAQGQVALATAAADLVGPGRPHLDARIERAMLAELRSNGVQAVMLTPVSNESGIAAFLTGLFGAPLLDTGGVLVWRLPAAPQGAPWRHPLHHAARNGGVELVRPGEARLA